MYQIDFKNPVHVYFIGIGGISMSGLAQILIKEGFKVSGSDAKESDMTRTLSDMGVKIIYGQKKENILSSEPIDVVVYTAAVHPDNPEFMAAKEAGIPMLTRAELLGQIMKEYELPVAISGTHGKTTTTSMLSKILLTADTDPTLSIGGIFADIGGNIRVGNSEYFVTEACEYTNSFLSFFPKISVITNIDADHLDFFKDLDDIRHSFKKFAHLLPDDGTLIISGDIENVSEITEGLNCSIITYGSSSSFDYYPSDIVYDDKGNPSFTAHLPGGCELKISLSVPGLHNVYNVTGAIIAAHEFLNLDYDNILKSVETFTGVDGRMEKVATVNGKDIIVDYAHNPAGVQTVLREIKKIHGDFTTVITVASESGPIGDEEIFKNALRYSKYVIPASVASQKVANNLLTENPELKDRIFFDSIDNFKKEGTIGASYDEVYDGIKTALYTDSNLIVAIGEAATKYKSCVNDL